ncbi:hypothetical protein DWB61_13190 [Ancylomarina euxinus]|uniref:Uncharacterized protein n=1 Tax=Ancylomarina euxinus TaxID=2283627 RepID=A0A425XYS4_9BACT|nr:hypothetical protein [Ancylomarina euxinus]MCZ4695642.1 hypothetical protein [Ancylomarina euxinus]MUP16054.1 hypothetical protein [Ancylomarina euxinus]RRG20298.1 hypothetical protein DWB61_13190 [Ancylomarina euxinus]
MNLPDYNHIKVSKYRDKVEILKQVAAQIEKDFYQFGFEVTFTGVPENAYNELFSQIIEHVGFMLSQDYHRLVLLLYQIDLSENEILKNELKYPNVDKDQLLSELIIQRELKKVLIRNYFKENPDKL